MNTFCGNCGTAIPEGSAFCPNCGAAAPNAPANNTASEGGKKFDMKKLVISVVAIVLVVLLCVLLFSGCGNGASSAEKVAKKYAEATFESCDYADIIELYHEDTIEDRIDDGNFDDEDEMIEDMSEDMQDRMDDLEKKYDNLSISWEVKKVKDADKSVRKEIREFYDDEYDLEVDEVKIAHIEVTYEYEDDDGDEDDFEEGLDLRIVEIGGRWYLD